jgi:hypothetical protein
VFDAATNKYFAVHLEGAIAEKITVIEASGRAEYSTKGVMRLMREMEIRHAKKGW